jgi:hypothetical protein
MVNGFNRFSQPWRQQPGSDREIFVMIDRHEQEKTEWE